MASLAINLLLVGLIAGSYLNGRSGPPRGYDLQLGPLAQVLPREDRRKIGDRIRAEVGASGQSRRERRAAFEALLAAVEAQPFDPERLSFLISAQQDRQDIVRSAAIEAFVAHLTTLTADERQSLAENLREGIRNGRDGERRPPGPRPSSGG